MMVGVGLLFSATAGPETLGGYRAWPVVTLVAGLFVAAVVAAVAEARAPGGRAAGGPAPGV